MMTTLFILAVLNLIALGVVILRQSNRPAVDIRPSLEQLEKGLERIERSLREEIAVNRGEQLKGLQGFSKALTDQLNTLTQSVERQLKSLRDENAQKLEKIRETVDEKLHATLEKRLGESFQLVSDRLEKVHQGLGEMQNLAAGVGDLKKVLTNVKTRGTWGEIQLESLLDQLLIPEQYEKNIVTKRGSRDPVEFAIRLPRERGVFIPIDAKFPKEDYERLIQAQEEGNSVLVEEHAKAIEARIKMEAKKINEKYIDPPQTTDFAILYLPIEGLYAEVLRRPGLFDQLQREFRVIIAGPTTIAAILNALQMGFRTLAVEKRASEVWNLLGSVKNEFSKFGDLLEKAQKKLESAGEEIGNAARKSRTIEKELKDVQVLSPVDAQPKVIDISP